MTIPAYIIDEILKDRARRQLPVLEELQIEIDAPRDIIPSEPREDESQRGIAEIDFFL